MGRGAIGSLATCSLWVFTAGAIMLGVLGALGWYAFVVVPFFSLKHESSLRIGESNRRLSLRQCSATFARAKGDSTTIAPGD